MLVGANNTAHVITYQYESYTGTLYSILPCFSFGDLVGMTNSSTLLYNSY